jgi:hypothetical protein
MPMKTTFPLTVGIVVALCADLLLALPKYPAAELEKANSEYSKSGGDSIHQQIISKEREELDSLEAGNLELLGNLLADDVVFVDAQGPASKAEVLKNAVEFRLLECSTEDVRFRAVSIVTILCDTQ